MIKERLAASGKAGVSKGQVVIATVKGDIHDIGKNIVKVIMENYGFEMIDLGRDVPQQPPAMAIPRCRYSAIARANSSGPMV